MRNGPSRAVVALGLALALPSLGIGFFADDYSLIGELEHRFTYNPRWWDLYQFFPGGADLTRRMIAGGDDPWWSAPDLRLHLLRPLPSALIALDHAVFGRWALG